MIYYIYTLKYDNKIFYIGSSKKIKDRINSHFNQIKQNKINEKYNEFFENKNFKLYSYEILDIIEINFSSKMNKDEAIKLEKFYIDKYKNNNLLNKKKAFAFYKCDFCNFCTQNIWKYKNSHLKSSQHIFKINNFMKNILNDIFDKSIIVN